MSSRVRRKRLLITGLKSPIDVYSRYVSIILMKQPIHCRACGSQFFTDFSDDNETCSNRCKEELGWRKQLAAQKTPYEPQPGEPSLPRHITVAELDRCPALDEILSTIERAGTLTIKRYRAPVFFKKAEWKFPVVTVWYGGGLNNKSRVYGELDCLEKLNSLSESSEPHLTTRRISRALLLSNR